MNELQVKTIEFEPAKVKFNKEDIESHLDESLKKYQGLVFTEDNTSQLRSTLAELRKGKKAIDEYRKQTKKQLNDPVKQFEDDCKALNTKFDDVINPLAKQLDDFETERKAKKQAEIETLINRVIDDYELDSKFASELVVEDEYLAKSRSMKEIEGTLTFKADHLKAKQDKLETDKKLIESEVKAVNAENGLSFNAEPYIRSLEFQDANSVLEQIKNDAAGLIKKREEERIAEEQRKQEEIERIQQEQSETESQAKEDDMKRAGIPFKLDFENTYDDGLVPFEPDEDELMPDPFTDVEPGKKTVTYTVTASEEEHIEISEFILNAKDAKVIIDE